jgi:hypothetical protein
MNSTHAQHGSLPKNYEHNHLLPLSGRGRAKGIGRAGRSLLMSGGDIAGQGTCPPSVPCRLHALRFFASLLSSPAERLSN